MLPFDQPMSNTARRRHGGPYEAAVVPRIAELDLRLSSRELTEAGEATEAIARFDAEAGHRVVPFSSILLRSESAASSRIEQLTATAKAIALAELGEERSANARMIVSNARAMNAAIVLADELDENAVIAMHTALLEHEHPEWTGHWRDAQVWIGGDRFGPHGAMFVPPHHDQVPKAMTDLVTFARRDDIPALVQAAIAHAQFETIHPFPDGNGRTGRALVHSMLRRRGVTKNVTVPISAGLLTDTAAYFDALGAYRRGVPEVIVGQVADAAFASIDNARQMLGELDQITHGWRDRLSSRADSSVWPLTELLVSQPAVNLNVAMERLAVSKQAASTAINVLEEAGVLVKAKGEQRNRAWVAIEIVEALDQFAARAGRRSRH
jgi:Fic family protein